MTRDDGAKPSDARTANEAGAEDLEATLPAAAAATQQGGALVQGAISSAGSEVLRADVAGAQAEAAGLPAAVPRAAADRVGARGDGGLGAALREVAGSHGRTRFPRRSKNLTRIPRPQSVTSVSTRWTWSIRPRPW